MKRRVFEAAVRKRYFYGQLREAVRRKKKQKDDEEEVGNKKSDTVTINPEIDKNLMIGP